MINSNIIFIGLFAAIVLTGCRIAKPTVISEMSTDSLTISANTSIGVCYDSIIISEKTGILTDEKVEFVEGGGSVFISDDGALYMSGVAAVSSSRIKSSERKEETKSMDMQAHSKDSVVAANLATSYSESKPTVVSGTGGWRKKYVVVALVVLIILILVTKIRKKYI